MVIQTAEIQIKRDTANNWITNNPILLSGEQGFETDTGKMKIGNGQATWTSLPYTYVQPTQTSVIASLGYTPLNPSNNLSDVANPSLALANLGGGGGGTSAIVGELKWGLWTPSNIPSGFLIPDGTAISRTTYSQLFSLIGTTYGAGNGSTTFNLPKIQGAMLVAQGISTDGVTYNVSQVGGASTTTLTTAQMPAHNHGFTDPGHNHGVTDPGHTHTLQVQLGGGSSYSYMPAPAVSQAPIQRSYNMSTATTGVTIASTATGITINSIGSGQSFSNMPPYIVVTIILKVA